MACDAFRIYVMVATKCDHEVNVSKPRNISHAKSSFGTIILKGRL
jgi:hypothetical protein